MENLFTFLILGFAIGCAALLTGHCICTYISISKTPIGLNRSRVGRRLSTAMISGEQILARPNSRLIIALICISFFFAFGFDLLIYPLEVVPGLFLGRPPFGDWLHSAFGFFSLINKFATLFHIAASSALEMSQILRLDPGEFILIRVLLSWGWIFSLGFTLFFWRHFGSLTFSFHSISYTSPSPLIRLKLVKLDLFLFVVLGLVTIWLVIRKTKQAVMKMNTVAVEDASIPTKKSKQSSAAEQPQPRQMPPMRVQLFHCQCVFLQLVFVLAHHVVYAVNQLHQEPTPSLGCAESVLHIVTNSNCLILVTRSLRLVLGQIKRNPPTDSRRSSVTGDSHHSSIFSQTLDPLDAASLAWHKTHSTHCTSHYLAQRRGSRILERSSLIRSSVQSADRPGSAQSHRSHQPTGPDVAPPGGQTPRRRASCAVTTFERTELIEMANLAASIAAKPAEGASSCKFLSLCIVLFRYVRWNQLTRQMLAQ